MLKLSRYLKTILLRQEVSNYRPISILAVLSKKMEKHVHSVLYSYLIKHSLLSSSQSGFRRLHSCETALINIMDSWMEAIDKGKLIGTIFLDLSKAFDLVDHDILLHKLRIYGLSSNAHQWFKSYLTDRKQCTYIEGVYSAQGNLTCGVPQGSVLGPLLFLIHLNDLDLFLTHAKADMYADDTSFHVSGKNIEEINKRLNKDAGIVSSWCDNNRMIINTEKTKSMLIGSKQRIALLGHPSSLSIIVNNSLLKNVNCEKLLGVKIDSNLLWHDQVDYICTKVNNRLALLRRIKPFIDRQTCILYYNGYILPIIDYCSIIWSTCNNGEMQRVIKLQKAAARII